MLNRWGWLEPTNKIIPARPSIIAGVSAKDCQMLALQKRNMYNIYYEEFQAHTSVLHAYTVCLVQSGEV